MPTHSMSAALAQEALNAVALHGTNGAAVALGVPRTTIQSRVHAAKRLKLTPGTGIVDPDNIQSLRDRVKRLEAELRGHERQDDEVRIIKGVIGALAHKVEEYDPPEWTIRPKDKRGFPGTPTLFLSDLHWGEKVAASQIGGVNSYSVRIAHSRMATLIDSAMHLLQIISPKMDYPGIVLPLGGDMVSGNIHEELTATNELNSMPTILDLYGVLVGVIRRLADVFGAVFIPCVTGNHGRDTRKMWAKDRHHTSFDWLLYQFLAKHFENDKRVTFHIPDGPSAYYKVFGHRYWLTHGDAFRGGDGIIGALGPIIRGDHRTRSRNSQINMEYDTLICGHWHSYTHLGRLIVNGTLKGYDEYAYANGFPFEQPQQALWLTHPKHGITYRMPVYVGSNRAAPPKATWIEIPEA